jgi:hypothetical protein
MWLTCGQSRFGPARSSNVRHYGGLMQDDLDGPDGDLDATS